MICMATKKTKAVKEVNEKQEAKFTKEQILASKKYTNRRDALSAILADGKEYTCTQVDSLLDEFMKGKVN